jgi:hypothetical protein
MIYNYIIINIIIILTIYILLYYIINFYNSRKNLLNNNQLRQHDNKSFLGFLLFLGLFLILIVNSINKLMIW